MEQDNTSSDASATQNAGSPATGTPASGSATLQKPSPTVEELLMENAELKRTQGNATEEVERHRKKLTAYEKKEAEAEAAKKAADEAQLSEIERVKKQHTESMQQIERYKEQLTTAQVKIAAQSLGIIDPDMAALAIRTSLEYDKDGLPTNVDDALKALIKNKPYFVAPKSAEPAPEQSVQSARLAPPIIPAMSPGRTNIPAPGSNPPGKIPSLRDVFNRP